MKLALQHRTDEVPIFDYTRMAEARKTYLVKMHTKRIPMEDEPTAEQLSALHTLVKEKGPPCVDFAVWGPYNDRVRKAMSHRGYTFGPDGKLTPEEFRGPPTIEQWSACWRVFMCGMIMLNEAEHPTLEAYGRHINKLARQFGEKCWPTIYQAEVRFRREMLSRVRDEQEELLQQALEANGTHPFDPERPWEQCFDVAITGQQWLQYWADEVTLKCIILLSSSTSPSHYLHGDAEIASSSTQHMATRYMNDDDEVPQKLGTVKTESVDRRRPPPTRHDNPRPVKVQKVKAERAHHVSGGLFTHNRKGAALCHGYQDGSCTGLLCPKGFVHQCNKCLDTRHGSSSPHPCQSVPAAPTGKGSGKKGGGKKGGKKGGAKS